MTFLGAGLAVCLLVVGGFAVDLWRVLVERRHWADVADAAAAAGANGVDVDHYRSTGEVRLDPEQAVALAAQSLAGQPDRDGLRGAPRVAADDTTVVVELDAEVDLTLLRLVALAGPVTVTVSASAVPVRGR